MEPRTVNVYQCERDEWIPLELMAIVRYIGESFGVDALTDGKEYNIVRDQYGYPKVVDDSDEDYIYDLVNPRPLDNSSEGGRFEVLEDYTGEVTEIIKRKRL
jgi:hypothetical protein